MSGTFLLLLVRVILTGHIAFETVSALRLEERQNEIELVKYSFSAHGVYKGERTLYLSKTRAGNTL